LNESLEYTSKTVSTHLVVLQVVELSADLDSDCCCTGIKDAYCKTSFWQETFKSKLDFHFPNLVHVRRIVVEARVYYCKLSPILAKHAAANFPAMTKIQFNFETFPYSECGVSPGRICREGVNWTLQVDGLQNMKLIRDRRTKQRSCTWKRPKLGWKPESFNDN